MKRLFTLLILIGSLTPAISIAQGTGDIYTDYQKKRQAITDAQSAAEKAVFNSWALPNPLTPGHAYSACDGWPGAGYKCKAHNLQCCSKGCYPAYLNAKKKVSDGYVAKIAQCDADYEKLRVVAVKANEEKQVRQEQADKQTQKKNAATPAQIKLQDNSTNSNIADAQKKQYQQQANGYLNAADNSTGIENAKNLSLAKINAMGAGNTIQATQIQQQVNQQQNDAIVSILNNAKDMIISGMNASSEKKKVAYKIFSENKLTYAKLSGTLLEEGNNALLANDFNRAIDKFFDRISLEAQISYNDIKLSAIYSGAKYLNEKAIMEDYFPTVKNEELEGPYTILNLPETLPDIYYLPLCHCYTKPVYKRVYDDAFILLRDIAKCKSLNYNGNNYNVAFDKKTPIQFNEATAIATLNKVAELKKIENFYDWIDYTNSYVWLGYLENKNAKTVGDLYNGANTLLTFYQQIQLGVPFVKQLHIGEASYLESSYNLINYFLADYYIRIAKTIKDTDLNKKIAFNLSQIANNSSLSLAVTGQYTEESSNEIAKTYSDIANSLKATRQLQKSSGSIGFSMGKAKNIALTISSKGTPYVVYIDGGNNDAPTVMEWNGSNWITVGNADTDFASKAYSPTIVIDNKETPYIAYADFDKEYRATVKKYIEGKWELVGNAGFTENYANFPFLTIDKKGIPYIVYSDFSHDVNGSPLQKPTVMKFSGTGWVKLAPNEFKSHEISSRMVIDNNGTPYITTSGGMKYTGKNWESIGGGITNDIIIDDASIAIDNGGILYMAYSDSKNEITVKQFKKGTWIPVGKPMLSADKIMNYSMAINGNGTPYMVYSVYSETNSKPTILKLDGNNWTTLGNAEISVSFGGSISIAFDDKVVPYIAFPDKNNGDKATVMKFDGKNWTALH